MNYVTSKKLKAEFLGTGLRKGIKLVQLDQDDGPKIGHSATAETALPSRWKGVSSTRVIWDAPGWDDNRGEDQDIINAYCVQQLLAAADSVKFVFVSDIADLSGDNVKQFMDFLNKICIILPNIDKFVHNVGIIFTKVEHNITIEQIVETLRDEILKSDMQISDSVKNLIQSFVDSSERIGLFIKPEKEGFVEIGSLDHKGQVSRVIKRIEKISKNELQEIQFGLSLESKIFLNESYKFLDTKKGFISLLDGIIQVYSQKVETIIKELKKSHNKEIQHEKNMEVLSDLKSEIQSLNKLEILELSEFLRLLGNISPEVSEVVSKSKIWEYASFLDFLSAAIGVSFKEIFRAEFQKVGALISKEWDKAYYTLEMYKGSISKQEYSKAIAEKEELYKEIEQDQNKIIKQYEIKNLEQVDQNLTALEVVGTFAAGVGGLVGGALSAGLAAAGLAIGGALGIAATPFIYAVVAAKGYYDRTKEEKEHGRQLVLDKEKEKKINKIQLDLNKEAKILQEKVYKLQTELVNTGFNSNTVKYQKLENELKITQATLTQIQEQINSLDNAMNQKSESKKKCEDLKAMINGIMEDVFSDIKGNMMALESEKFLSLTKKLKLLII